MMPIEQMVIPVEERIRLRGCWEILVHEHGRLISYEITPNVILDIGAALAVQRLFGLPVLPIIGFAAGQNNQTAVAGQTGLLDERHRGALTSAIPAGRSLTATYVMGTQQGNGFTYAEVALVTTVIKGAVGDAALNRAVVTPVLKTDAKTITYRCTVSA